jgi:molecular chaperone HscB
VSTHFDLFDLPRGFRLDLTALDQRYRALSQQHHPDKFASSAPKERLQALERTTELNTAYKVLRDPAARASYLLKLEGLDLDREDAHAHAMDPAFLMDILERREALDAVRKAGDLDQALKMGREIAALEKATHAELGALFEAQQSQPSAERLKKLADRVAALRYYRRFQDEVARMHEEANP